MKSMTKRMLSLFLCACMMLAVFGYIVPQTGAASTSGSCGDNVTWSFNTSTGHLTIRGSGTMNDNNPWKTNYIKAIISVSIGNGVKNISEFAFYNCVNLKKASIGSSVEEIADRAFYNTNLESIAIPNSVLEIGEYCFASCENLVSVDLPNKLKELDGYAFDGCKRLSSIDIPGTLKIIPSNCFRGNSALKKLVLPEGVEVIGSHAFSCGIETIQLPNTLKRINPYAFKGSAIREINIPASISIIEEFTFSQCHNLTQVTLPYSIKEVRRAAFKGCDNLKRVILPGYLTYIATDVFSFCEKLETVVFLNPDTVIAEFCLNWVPYITGYAGSTAQTYAENRNLEFRPISYYDVMPWQWYYEATDYVTETGLMNGVATRKFDPESSMTRAMVVTVLWRYEGSPAAPSSTFSDVADGTWYDQAVSWAAECGVVNGVGNNKFDPNGLVTREQIATIIYRYSLMNRINTAGREDLSTFPDDDKVSGWSYDAMSWAVAEGLIGGMTVGNGGEIHLKPEGNATRAQVATILMRFVQNVAGNKVAENIAMLGECGTIDDWPYNAPVWEGLENWSKSNSEQEINHTYYIPSEESTDARLQAIDEAVSEGATTIICSGYLYAPALIEAQSKYPNVKFIGIDIALGDMTEDYVDYYEPTENTMLITYREEQAGFLAGYAAVKLGYRKLGFLGGMGIPTVLRYGYGYVQGANAAAEELGVADEVEIEYTYANCFYATHDLTALMQEWYSNGTEVVFACGGGIYMSVAEAAAMYGGKVIGVDADQAEIIDGFYGEGITLTTAVKGFAYSVEYALDAIYNRSAWNLYGGECTNFGAQDGGDSGNGFVMLPESTQFDDSFTYEDYVALWNKLASGEIMVSDDFQAPPTVSVAVNYH